MGRDLVRRRRQFVTVLGAVVFSVSGCLNNDDEERVEYDARELLNDNMSLAEAQDELLVVHGDVRRTLDAVFQVGGDGVRLVEAHRMYRHGEMDIPDAEFLRLLDMHAKYEPAAGESVEVPAVVTEYVVAEQVIEIDDDEEAWDALQGIDSEEIEALVAEEDSELGLAYYGPADE